MKNFLKSCGIVLSLATAVTTFAQSTYQLPNVGFDSWESAKGKLNWTEKNAGQSQPGSEPVSWYSSNIKFVLSEYQLIQEKNENDRHYANIINKKTGQVSAYIPTLGVLSLAPSWECNQGNGAAGNFIYNYENKNKKYAQNGVYGGVSFEGRPDAVVAVMQNYSDEGHVIAYLWKGTYAGEVPSVFEKNKITKWQSLENLDRAIWSQIDPSIVTSETVQNVTKTDDAEIIAYCDQKFTDSFSWNTVEIPLTYLSNNQPEMTNVILAAGYPWDSRKVTAEKSINVDSVYYAYYSRLSSASISGYEFSFDPNTYEYTITVGDTDAFSLPETVDYTVMSNSALTAEKTVTVTRNEENKSITVTVTNNAYAAGNTDATDVDGLGSHTYTFYFRNAANTLDGFYFTNVDNSTTDLISGASTTVEINQGKENINTYDLSVQNAQVDNSGETVNIYVSGLIVPNFQDDENDSSWVLVGSNVTATVGDKDVTAQVYARITDNDNYEIAIEYANEDGTTTRVVVTPEPATSSVSKVAVANATVSASAGMISVVGYNGNVEVYTTDGRLAATAKAQGTAQIQMASGLYIVRAGNTAAKVIVK